MSKYWKIDMLKKLIKLEEEEDIKATITMSYLSYLKKNLRLMEEFCDIGATRIKEDLK